MKKERIIPIINALILIYYMWDYDIPSRILFTIIGIILGLSLLSIPLASRRQRIFRLIANVQVSVFSILLVLFGLEIIHHFAPGSFPTHLRSYLAETDISEARNRMVQYLDESPFVKFKANTIIRSQGYRGDDTQFCYEWLSDPLGFKNPPDLLATTKIKAVALGDSFTEGQGVAISDTWPAMLTKKGLPTYNLGVQAYAPVQIEGAFVNYGINLFPRFVIIGYCGTTFKREAAFFDIEYAKRNKSFTGAIQSPEQARHMISAIYLAVRHLMVIKASYFRRGPQALKDTDISFVPFRRYSEEICQVGMREQMIREIEGNCREWSSTLSRFLSIAEKARAIQSEVVLVYLPNRGEVYYAKATGKPLPERSLEKRESELLREFCMTNGIHFINLFDKLVEYVDTISVETPMSNYPYLEIDGHMSRIGHEIVAKEIRGALSHIDRQPDA